MTMTSDHHWTLVLAAGAGKRLSSLTTDAFGETVPKQFCSLNGSSSLLSRTLERAFRIVPASRTVAIVAAEHERHWQPILAALPADNVITQPANRGTGIGILLPLLHILNRDPDARIVLLPSDHHVHDEPTFQAAIRQALAAVDRDITLLGITPDSADPELGYIVTGNATDHGRHQVALFVEKPTPQAAECLVSSGALWNSFVIAAQGHTLLELIADRYPSTVLALCEPVATGDPGAVASVYATLADVDFSRDIVAPATRHIKCMAVPSCGWTDLGTPHRVAQCLVQQHPGMLSQTASHPPAVLDLAEAIRRRQARQFRSPETARQLVGELS